jgi:hypothetical protein
MDAIFGADLLTNPKIAQTESVNLGLPELSSIELPTFESNIKFEEPRLMPELSSVGELRSSSGLENMNAEPFLSLGSSSSRKMSEENILKEKYEMLRKFERLAKLGVPLRKRFTLDSPIEEMRIELDFVRREKAMDQTIKQFCDWYITGMSALEWSSKNVGIMKAFGLNLDGLSESAQMNVGDMEDDFEELYDLYGDSLKMHPLVRIPIRTCMMVYMVHLTNQMTLKAPIPNIDQILKTNPDIARQLATAAMQQQTTSMRGNPVSAASIPASNPLAGLSNFMSGMIPPPPQQTNVRPPPPTTIKSPVKLPSRPMNPPISIMKPSTPQPQPPQTAAREMKGPQVNIDDLLKSVNSGVETKRVATTPTQKRGGSTGKNSVTIKL